MEVQENNMEVIREYEYFTCNIDGVDYKCYVDLNIGWYTGHRITVVVKKYSEKKFWKFKYKALDFEYKSCFDLSIYKREQIDVFNYFDASYIKKLVEKTLQNKYYEERENQLKKKRDSRIKVITKI